MEKISAVYQIVNEVTGDRYVGSSRNVKQRWRQHKKLITWKRNPNKKLYQDFQKYGIENFRFQILAPVETEHLKQVEQEFIEMLRPSYNDRRSEGLDVERVKETKKKYQKEYNQTEKHKEANRKCNKNYYNQPCLYNGETLTLKALFRRFQRAGIEHPTLEAKKYLIR